jgi:hypothetical protein
VWVGGWVCGCVGVWVCVCVLPSANVLCLTQNMARMHIKVQQTLPDACLRSEAVRAKKKNRNLPSSGPPQLRKRSETSLFRSLHTSFENLFVYVLGACSLSL